MNSISLFLCFFVYCCGQFSYIPLHYHIFYKKYMPRGISRPFSFRWCSYYLRNLPIWHLVWHLLLLRNTSLTNEQSQFQVNGNLGKVSLGMEPHLSKQSNCLPGFNVHTSSSSRLDILMFQISMTKYNFSENKLKEVWGSTNSGLCQGFQIPRMAERCQLVMYLWQRKLVCVRFSILDHFSVVRQIFLIFSTLVLGILKHAVGCLAKLLSWCCQLIGTISKYKTEECLE